MAPPSECVAAMQKFFVTEESMPGQSAVLNECRRCRKRFRGTHTRRRAHIVGKRGKGIEVCSVVLETEKTAYLDMERRFGDNHDNAERSRASEKRKHCDSASGDGDGEGEAENLQRQQLQATQIRGPLAASFAKATKASLDQKVARFIYANGIPFNVTRCPHFQEMLRAVAVSGCAYAGPEYNSVRAYFRAKKVSQTGSAS